MSEAPTPLRTALALVALSAALSGALWQGFAEADTEDPGTATEAGPDAAVVVDARTAEPAPVEAWAATVLARPLFHPRRRPDTSGSPQVVAELPRLTGVLVGPEERLAFFAGLASGRPQVVREGGNISGHVVQLIRPGEVVLTGPLGQHVLHLNFVTQP